MFTIKFSTFKSPHSSFNNKNTRSLLPLFTGAASFAECPLRREREVCGQSEGRQQLISMQNITSEGSRTLSSPYGHLASAAAKPVQNGCDMSPYIIYIEVAHFGGT